MHFVWKTAGALLLPLAAASHAFAAPVEITAQPVVPSSPVYSQVRGGGAAADLSRYLTMLGDNPDSLVALTGAGRAALELGDAEAALNFFGRAEELSPRDGPIKAGIGSAMVLMEQPEAALQFFYEASRLGVPAIEMAAFRGLAYDLTGDPSRAQQDYQLALRRREDPEVRRRLALSLAISGQRDAALNAIDYQLRRQDRAAWRTRAFILALTGDAQGATRVVEAVMPYQAAELAPFLVRLPSLSLADRARAVHFGHFPGAPASVSAQATTSPVPVQSSPFTSAGQPDPGQRPFGRSAAAPSAPRPSAPVAPVAPRPTPPPGRIVSLNPPPAASGPGVLAATRPPRVPVTVMPPPASLAPGFSVQPPPPLAPGGSSTAIAPKSATPPILQPARPAPPTSSLADIATVIARLTDPPAGRAQARPVPAASTKAAAPGAIESGRTWVQISRSRTDVGLASEYRRISSKAPSLFADKAAWTSPAGPTNRLLVGPFESNKEAQDFANQVKETGTYAFSWTSDEGQEIKKLPGK